MEEKGGKKGLDCKGKLLQHLKNNLFRFRLSIGTTKETNLFAPRDTKLQTILISVQQILFEKKHH